MDIYSTGSKKCINYLQLNKKKLRELDIDLETEEDLVLLLDKLLKADPDPRGKNCIWIIDQFKNRQFLLEDVSRVNKDISEYLKENKKLPDSYSILKQNLSKPKNKEEIEKLLIKQKEGDIQILYRGPLGLLLIPNTIEASCKYGANTRWCTAAIESENFFEDYAANGPLYIWIDKETGKKFQFHFEDRQFKNENDDNLEEDAIEYFRKEHPILKKLFKKREKDLMERPIWAYRYAKDVIGGRFPEAEKYIFQHPSYGIEYMKNVVKTPLPEAEEVFIKDPISAAYYAKLILKDRWPEAEEVIKRNPEALEMYNRFLRDLKK
jgi:hypothetical protein